MGVVRKYDCRGRIAVPTIGRGRRHTALWGKRQDLFRIHRIFGRSVRQRTWRTEAGNGWGDHIESFAVDSGPCFRGDDQDKHQDSPHLILTSRPPNMLTISKLGQAPREISARFGLCARTQTNMVNWFRLTTLAEIMP